MEIFGPPVSPDVLDDQRASDALVKLVRKLRWMGMDDEVERIEMTLAARGNAACRYRNFGSG